MSDPRDEDAGRGKQTSPPRIPLTPSHPGSRGDGTSFDNASVSCGAGGASLWGCHSGMPPGLQERDGDIPLKPPQTRGEAPPPPLCSTHGHPPRPIEAAACTPTRPSAPLCIPSRRRRVRERAAQTARVLAAPGARPIRHGLGSGTEPAAGSGLRGPGGCPSQLVSDRGAPRPPVARHSAALRRAAIFSSPTHTGAGAFNEDRAPRRPPAPARKRARAALTHTQKRPSERSVQSPVFHRRSVRQ
ncbi:hypothetical protein AAFF_G00074380 [Aldrovandia affinis]|uniref:Uncharacterized protein n=1 Tax=Aldrovandia affinis TaxID=143900 RepID=A0AAD7RYB0_9TELE|nr:hypothetical protein AAFF_G00074380 [Aldrovandia affinis]